MYLSLWYKFLLNSVDMMFSFIVSVLFSLFIQAMIMFTWIYEFTFTTIYVSEIPKKIDSIYYLGKTRINFWN